MLKDANFRKCIKELSLTKKLDLNNLNKNSQELFFNAFINMEYNINLVNGILILK